MKGMIKWFWIVKTCFNQIESCSADGLEETVVLSGLKNFNSSISGGSWKKKKYDNENTAFLK